MTFYGIDTSRWTDSNSEIKYKIMNLGNVANCSRLSKEDILLFYSCIRYLLLDLIKQLALLTDQKREQLIFNRKSMIK